VDQGPQDQVPRICLIPRLHPHAFPTLPALIQSTSHLLAPRTCSHSHTLYTSQLIPSHAIIVLRTSDDFLYDPARTCVSPGCPHICTHPHVAPLHSDPSFHMFAHTSMSYNVSLHVGPLPVQPCDSHHHSHAPEYYAKCLVVILCDC
jgi:hypothetical protein